MSATTTPTPSTRAGLLGGKSPLLRLQSDERLIGVLRSGNGAAFDVLFGRYRTRLLGFCRHMLASKEDAEDVLQEVFAAAYNAILADEREINVRPWLYRIARNRCLNHLRRPTADGTDTMDDHVYGHGVTAADIVHKRADVRHLLAGRAEASGVAAHRPAAARDRRLSYDQIAEAMETTIPSVKSLLVRARMSLAEAAESRQLTCDDVRQELAEIAEGLKKASPPVRRHLRECETCGAFRSQLRKTNTAMALAFPIGPLMILKKLALLKLGSAAVAGGGGGGAAARRCSRRPCRDRRGSRDGRRCGDGRRSRHGRGRCHQRRSRHGRRHRRGRLEGGGRCCRDRDPRGRRRGGQACRDTSASARPR